MSEKHYPKTVTMRRNLVLFAIGIVVIIISVILYNLAKTMHDIKNPKVAGGNTAQTYASSSDMKWYQNSTIAKTKPVAAVKASPSKPTTTAGELNKSVVTALPQGRAQSATDEQTQAEQDLQKAMSASISTNQITQNDPVEAPENNTSPSNDHRSLHPASTANASDSDQNQQKSKEAFVNNSSKDDSIYLSSQLEKPISPYELQAGSVIPGILVGGLNSDLPGMIRGQVTSNVYDSVSGNYLLIPQGAKLVGLYDSQVTYGQERILVVWQRIIFPSGKSIDLEGMQGVDLSGYAGFKDQVDNHYVKIFSSVILMSALSAGAQLSQPQNSNTPWSSPSVGQTMGQSLGTNLSNVGSQIFEKDINIQPTLKIRPGYQFDISVKKDIVFDTPYQD